jgi:glycosyltransferase involved in cell wall biosynthesis
MRVLSIATLVSPDGAYGGPVRVAVNQAVALRQRGHEVTIAASTRGYDDVPRELEGVPARLFPARTLVPGVGFAGLAAPELWRWLRRNAGDFDVCHIHAARDLVTLPGALIADRRGLPFVLQTHGMIDRSENPLAVPVDAVFTRPALRRAERILYLTSVEREGLLAVGGDDLKLLHLPNGVPFADERTPSDRVEVLYLARLAPRKRPDLFARVAAALSEDFPWVRFALVGPDEGEADRVQATIAGSGFADRIAWEGPLAPDATVDRLRRAAIYVLPSVDEPYPMSVLEAMSVGLPVIVTDTCGLASAVADHAAGLVVDDREENLSAALRQLLADPDEARKMGARGRDYVRSQLDMGSIADRLVTVYSAAVSR